MMGFLIHVSHLNSRLTAQSLYREKYGADRVELLADSKEVDQKILDSNRAFLQVLRNCGFCIMFPYCFLLFFSHPFPYSIIQA